MFGWLSLMMQSYYDILCHRIPSCKQNCPFSLHPSKTGTSGMLAPVFGELNVFFANALFVSSGIGSNQTRHLIG